jgi:hypothetical protein
VNTFLNIQILPPFLAFLEKENFLPEEVVLNFRKPQETSEDLGFSTGTTLYTHCISNIQPQYRPRDTIAMLLMGN